MSYFVNDHGSSSNANAKSKASVHDTVATDWTTVENLYLREFKGEEPAIKQLQAAQLTALKRIYIRNSRLNMKKSQRIANVMKLTKVKELTCQLTDETIDIETCLFIALSEQLRNVSMLGHQDHNRLNSFLKQKWPVLSILRIEGPLTDEGVTELLNAQLNVLRKLSLISCSLTSSGLKSLNNLSTSKLVELCLSKNKISYTGISYLVAANLIHLQKLFLSNCQLGSQGVKILMKGSFRKMKTVGLSECSINTQGFKALTKNNWKDLKEIMIGQMTFTNEDAVHLISCDWSKLKQLRKFTLSDYEQPSFLTFMIQMRSLLSSRFKTEHFLKLTP